MDGNQHKLSSVWVFTRAGWRDTISTDLVFSRRDLAESSIRQNTLSGVLTEYPLDVGVYDWAVARGYFTPAREEQQSPSFIGTFSDAHQEHFHYEGGERV